MDVITHNRSAWNTRVREGKSAYTQPVTSAQVEAARRGDWQLYVTPAPVPRPWLGDVVGKDVLCLASGGGQQGPVLAATGATVTVFDLADEQLVRPHASGWTPDADQLAWPAMSEREAIEVVGSGGGVALVPMSVARLFQRKDVASRPVSDLPPTSVALAWLVDRDDEATQTFVGVVRGRTARSSR